MGDELVLTLRRMTSNRAVAKLSSCDDVCLVQYRVNHVDEASPSLVAATATTHVASTVQSTMWGSIQLRRRPSVAHVILLQRP